MAPLLLCSLISMAVLFLGNTIIVIGYVDCFFVPEDGCRRVAVGRSGTMPSRSSDILEPTILSMSRHQESPMLQKNNLAGRERTIVILYHKPPNTITSHKSQDDRPTVYEDVQSMRGYLPTTNQSMHDSDNNLSAVESSMSTDLATSTFEETTGIRSKLHAIGRLDADTTGLLLLTNDGGLVHHVTNPDAKTATNSIHKTYQALIMGHHTEESLQPIREGVDIGKGYVTEALIEEDQLRILEYPNHKSTVVTITINEGKNRQIRKMFHAIGSGVMKLSRIRIGESLTLEGMKEGEWRVMTDAEVQRHFGWRTRIIVTESPSSPHFQQNEKRRKGRPNNNSLKQKNRRKRRR